MTTSKIGVTSDLMIRGSYCKKKIPWGGAKCKERGGEMVLILVVGWRASAVRGEEAGRFCKVAGVSIIAVGGPQ